MRDKVEREITIRASIERAFAALTDPAHFPTWGPERVEGVIAPGERPVLDFGAGGRCAVYVVAVDAPRYFAYRWKQGETDPVALLGDPLEGPNTLVEFHLEIVADGTRVRVVESGLSALPLPAGADRDKAAEGMEAGWGLMLGGLAKHFELPPTADAIANERVLPAPREDVYAALVAPAGWWAEKVEGKVAAGERAVFDFGPYGRYPVEVVATEPPSRVAYRWTRDGATTLVEYDLEDAGGATRLRQRESGFDALPDRDARFKRSHQGWAVILGLLERHLAR